MTINNQMKSFFYKANSTTFAKCFFPINPGCSKQAIKAHSIQNHGILRKLAEENHVIVLNSIQDSEDGPKLDFQKIGCNKATTFTGLCNEHDTHLFLPIDTKPIEISNQEHLFLLAYRSVLRELHAQCRNAIVLQNFYANGVEVGYFDHKEKDYPMMSATNWLLGAHGFYNFAGLWGEVYLSQNFERIKHQIIKLPNTKPTFAVSSVYSIINNMETYKVGDIFKCIAFNAFPFEDGVIAIWSYLDFQHSHFGSHLEALLKAKRNHRKHILSKLILKYCENFILAPSFYRSLTEHQIESIKK